MAKLALAAVLFSGGVQADTLTELQQCAATKDSLVRLVCYDNVMKSLNTGVSSHTATSNKVRPTQPAVTGQATPYRPTTTQTVVIQQPKSKEDSFGQEDKQKKDELDKVNFVIKSVKKDVRNKWLITFENGQVWQQTESGYLKLSAGDKVELSKGMLSAIYLKKPDSNKRIKVKRKK